MSEHLHPHDEQWDDMPLPNEDAAWQKMNLLLEKEEKRCRFLPFWLWRYGLAGLLLFGLATGGYFLLGRNDGGQANENFSKENRQLPEQSRQETAQRKAGPGKRAAQGTPASQERTPGNATVQDIERGTSVATEKSVPGYVGPQQKETREITGHSFRKQRELQMPAERKPVAQVKSSLPRTTVRTGNDAGETDKKGGVVISQPQPAISTAGANVRRTTDTVKQVATTGRKDSIARKDSTNISAAPPVVSNEAKKEKVNRKSSFVFSAGIGLQQAIAFSGQQYSAYNLHGKQSRLSDHIPSVYLRLQKGRWFVQGELHYNVPQPVKPFSFSQATSYHAVNATLRTERVTLQKLYYHQLPFSVNYFVLPQLSLGVGGTYNLLAGAVTEQETSRKYVSSGSETITRQVVPVKGYTDSFLYKSTAGILLQTDYHWKRFAIGLRYTKNLQPFIRYTTPDGAVLNEKNQVLQAVLRFRLF